MNKYNLDIQNGKIGENGLAEVAGWIKCYLSHPQTREYMGATMENVMFDVSLQSGAYLDEPKLPKKENQAIRRKIDGSAWEVVDDYRGLVAYHIQTKQPVNIDFIGSLPETLTLLQPVGEFDKWNGESWVADEQAIKEAQINSAKKQKIELSQEAENRIVQLERKIKLEMANDAEVGLLKSWEIYTVKLDDVNPELAPDIEWPQKPE
ncbi:tail fiber assembly protein [Hafnia alvei]|uniref:tail fiber assembly protein n=1 Tax=Proteus vulgaris TaxID=585 RepID=UPI00299E4A34|nr:tail fiber assembly protein [Proteus vulgaris]WOO51140.1 tail fiber assembly protein [Hafnia alvei]WPF05611.1 tail fiber assembly protein [Proteus vulgaris]